MQPFKVDWRPAAIEDKRALFEYLAENASLWDAVRLEKIRLANELPCEFERQPALSDVALVLCRVEADFHVCLWSAQ